MGRVGGKSKERSKGYRLCVRKPKESISDLGKSELLTLHFKAGRVGVKVIQSHNTNFSLGSLYT